MQPKTWIILLREILQLASRISWVRSCSQIQIRLESLRPQISLELSTLKSLRFGRLKNRLWTLKVRNWSKSLLKCTQVPDRFFRLIHWCSRVSKRRRKIHFQSWANKSWEIERTGRSPIHLSIRVLALSFSCNRPRSIWTQICRKFLLFIGLAPCPSFKVSHDWDKILTKARLRLGTLCYRLETLDHQNTLVWKKTGTLDQQIVLQLNLEVR